MSGPLTGLRVLDAGNMIAGPMAATLLADMGAEVIKLEHPTYGDPLRDWEPKKADISLWWKVLNRNKQLVTLNLSNEDGKRVFLDMVAKSDVVIENFRAGTFERWGLSHEELSKVNPKIVLVRVSGYGQTGPSRGKPGYGTIAEAMSGIPFFTGPRDAAPTLPGFPMADSVTAVFGAFSALAGIYERDHGSGTGQSVDLSLFESLFRLVDSQVIGYDQLGKVKERDGNRLEEDAPRNSYSTADGTWIAISASSNKTWARLAAAMNRPELADDPRFSTSSLRVKNVEELDGLIQDWFGGLGHSEVLAIMDEMDIVGGPMMNIEEIFADPQYEAREAIVSVPDADFGSVKMQSVVPKFSRTPGEVRHSGAAIGADNDAVYTDWLGIDPDELLRLKNEGAI